MGVAFGTVLSVTVVGGIFLVATGSFATSAMTGGAGLMALFVIPVVGLGVVVAGLLFGLRAVHRRIR